MKNHKKIWLRFSVIFLFQLIVKSFDQSYPNGPFEPNLRSVVFTIFFISYGLLVWRIADVLNIKFKQWVKKMKSEKQQLIVVSLLHAVFGYMLVLSLNHLYRLGDIHFFGNDEIWQSIMWLNPELTLSLLSFYLIVLGFDNYFQIQKKLQDELLKAEEMEKENILAQYSALKAQLEPHFLFNSLSVLSSLVYEDANLAADFILKLSKTLRYIIEKNEFNLVRLSEELEFLDAYFFLVKTRLDNGVFLENNLDRSFAESTFVPPVTLQLLVENAVKHNKYNPDDPLKITLEKKGGYIIVRNNLNPRHKIESSTKTGLINLTKRYRFVSKKEVITEKTDTEFIVKIPVLIQTDYERFNI